MKLRLEWRETSTGFYQAVFGFSTIYVSQSGSADKPCYWTAWIHTRRRKFRVVDYEGEDMPGYPTASAAKRAIKDYLCALYDDMYMVGRR